MAENCEIFRDLYDLYKDGICSEDSKKFIEEHLSECDECRNLIHAKTNGVPVVSKEKKVLKKVKKRISRKATFIICFVLAVSLIPFCFISILLPDLFLPPCITSDAQITGTEYIKNLSDEDVELIIKELKHTVHDSSHFDGSVLNKIRFSTALTELKYFLNFPDEYADVTFKKELLLYCDVSYYYHYGEFRDMDINMLFGAGLLDGEWIIIPLETGW